jgi:hypothetical protein
VLLSFVHLMMRRVLISNTSASMELAFRDVAKMERLSNNQSSDDLVPVILIISIALPFEWVQPVWLERGARGTSKRWRSSRSA